MNEIRQTTSGRQGDSRISEERVSRPDAEGKLREVSRVVSKASENSSGEKHNEVETYSIDVPGTPEDGSLHLVERHNGYPALRFNWRTTHRAISGKDQSW